MNYPYLTPQTCLCTIDYMMRVMDYMMILERSTDLTNVSSKSIV